MPGWLWLGVAIVLEVIGTSALQQSAQFTRPMPTTIMALCYAASFYALSVVVQTIPMGVAYAVWAGVGITLISLIGVLYLGQHLDRAAIVGIALISLGVVVINLFSGAGSH